MLSTRMSGLAWLLLSGLFSLLCAGNAVWLLLQGQSFGLATMLLAALAFAGVSLAGYGTFRGESVAGTVLVISSVLLLVGGCGVAVAVGDMGLLNPAGVATQTLALAAVVLAAYTLSAFGYAAVRANRGSQSGR